MEDAFVGSAIAKDANADLLAFLHLQRQPYPNRLWNAPADNAICAEVVGLKISDVHRAAAAVVVAGVFAQEFRHHQVDIRALGDEMSVPAMMINQIVLGTNCQANPCRHRLLPGRKVHRPMDFARRIQLIRHVLKVPDGAHGPIQADQALIRQVQLLHAFLKAVA